LEEIPSGQNRVVQPCLPGHQKIISAPLAEIFAPHFPEKQLDPKGMVRILKPVVNLSPPVSRRESRGAANQRAEELRSCRGKIRTKKAIDIHFEFC